MVFKSPVNDEVEYKLDCEAAARLAAALTRHSLATRYPGRRTLPTRFCTRLNLAADRSGYVNGRCGSGKDVLDACLAAGGRLFEHILPRCLFFQANCGRLRGGQSVNAGVVASWVSIVRRRSRPADPPQPRRDY